MKTGEGGRWGCRRMQEENEAVEEIDAPHAIHRTLNYPTAGCRPADGEEEEEAEEEVSGEVRGKKGGGGLVGAHVSSGAKLCVAAPIMRQAAHLHRHRHETGKMWKRREDGKPGGVGMRDGQTAGRRRRRKWAGGRGGAKKM